MADKHDTKGGAYVLMDYRGVVYAGCTKRFGQRMVAHKSRRGEALHPEKLWDTAICIPCNPGKARLLEAAIIAIFKPKYNRAPPDYAALDALQALASRLDRNPAGRESAAVADLRPRGKRLTQAQVESALPRMRKGVPRARLLSDGNNLALQIQPGAVKANGTYRVSRAWVFRYGVGRKEHRIGLGSLRKVSLKRARQLASDLQAIRKAGGDPLTEYRCRGEMGGRK